MSTIEPLWAFSALDRSLWPKGSKEVVERAAEFMLVHRLYKSDRTGKVIDEEWTRLHFPLFYFYDILHGLRVLADLRSSPAYQTETARGWDMAFGGLVRQCASMELHERPNDGRLA